jgi:hypothetical protein
VYSVLLRCITALRVATGNPSIIQGFKCNQILLPATGKRPQVLTGVTAQGIENILNSVETITRGTMYTEFVY